MFMRTARRLVVKMVAVIALAITSGTPTMAQSNSSQSAVGASAQERASKQWRAQDAQIIQCINTIYAAKNITADSFVAAGVGPTDQRVAPVITLCKAVMTAQPKVNFPCNVTNSSGQQVESTCSESYAVSRNGSLVAVSRDDFLRAAGDGEQVQVANFETVAAQNARLAGGRQQSEAERDQYWASPEGMRLWATITKMKNELACNLPSTKVGGKFNQEAHRRYEMAVSECDVRYRNIRFNKELMDQGIGWYIGILDLWKNGSSLDRMVEYYNEKQELHNRPVRIITYQDAAGIYIGPFPTHEAADNYHKINGVQMGFERLVDKTTHHLSDWPKVDVAWSNGIFP